jgi:hypothetical protein
VRPREKALSIPMGVPVRHAKQTRSVSHAQTGIKSCQLQKGLSVHERIIMHEGKNPSCNRTNSRMENRFLGTPKARELRPKKLYTYESNTGNYL